MAALGGHRLPSWGLRVEDVDICGDLPASRETWHEGRRLKTETSRRLMPLIGDALAAAMQALGWAQGEALLSPSIAARRAAGRPPRR